MLKVFAFGNVNTFNGGDLAENFIIKELIYNSTEILTLHNSENNIIMNNLEYLEFCRS